MAKVTRLGRKSSDHYAARHKYKPGSNPRRVGGKWQAGRREMLVVSDDAPKLTGLPKFKK